MEPLEVNGWTITYDEYAPLGMAWTARRNGHTMHAPSFNEIIQFAERVKEPS